MTDDHINRLIEQAHREWMDALDVVKDPIFMHDASYRIIRCNQAYSDYAGLPFKEIIGRRYYDIFPRSEAPSGCDATETGGITTEAHHEEITVGDNIFRSRAYPIVDSDGSYRYSVHILEDITERRGFERLLQSEKAFSESLIQSLPGLFFLLDQQGNFLEWNKKLEELSVRSRDALAGGNALQMMHDEDRPRVAERLKDAFERGTASTEARLMLKNGMRHYILTGNRVTTRLGVNLIGIGIDITERRKAELQLRQERDFSEGLIETAQVIVLILDPLGNIVSFNPYMEELSGYTLEEVLGREWFSLFIPEEERNGIRHLFLGAIDDIQTRGNVNTIVTKSGERRQIEWSDKTLKAPDGSTAGLLSIGTDVTERIASEARLKLFRSLLDHSDDAVEVLDPDTLRFIDVNETECRTLGYSREALLGMSVFDIDPCFTIEDLERLKDAGRAGGSSSFESVHRRRDGSTFPVEINATLVELDRPYILAIARDISSRKESEEALQRANRALRTLSAGNLALVRAQSEQKLLQQVCDIIVEIGGYSMAMVCYAETDAAKSLSPMAWAGGEGSYFWVGSPTWGDNEEGQIPVSRAIREARTRIWHNITQKCCLPAWREAAVARGFVSNIALPLFENGNVFGALSIYSADAEAFDEEEVNLLEEMADDLAYGIATLRTRAAHDQYAAQLRRSLEQSVQTIAATLEIRDPYTAGHQRRVAELATAIAREMALEAEQVEAIHFAAIIHDLGKINVPAEILAKPGRLSDLEFQLIQTHAQAGYDIIKDVAFPWPIADIIRQHHEKLDGSGYPQGLKGEAIRLEARIIGVADVVEAMSSHRPYRPSLGIEPALEEIRRGRNIHYDAVVVDACLSLFADGRFAFSDA